MLIEEDLDESELEELSEHPIDDIEEVLPDDPELLLKKHYFINEIVEDKLRRYIWTNCTNVAIRDSIMIHAPELIKQIIRKQNLHMIYPGQEESAFGDLVQTAWVQVERTLYKFRAKPHCRACYNPDRPISSALYIPAESEYGIITFEQLFDPKYTQPGSKKLVIYIKHHPVCPYCKTVLSDNPDVEPKQGTFGGSRTILFRGNSKVFNMWSQVSRTCILAFVKKEGRDRKNSTAYKDHLCNTSRVDEDRLKRFFSEASQICKYNIDHMRCIDALCYIIKTDDKPYDGLIGKLVEKSGLSRIQVNGFIRLLRLRSHEFTDSPLGHDADHEKQMKKQFLCQDEE
ncbi:MAG: hypothetical protein M0R50_10090 [Candidatus Cloacimonetes bacterium]|jgi:hypothetical protein|nr:hypothetical protein [Candidatus Cloacimonadota bacterium]